MISVSLLRPSNQVALSDRVSEKSDKGSSALQGTMSDLCGVPRGIIQFNSCHS